MSSASPAAPLSLQAFHLPTTPQLALFADLDETWRPTNPAAHATSGIRELETFLRDFVVERSALVGWVTGSNLDSALDKAAQYVGYYPHFISSSLGTELHWVREGTVQACEHWEHRLATSLFSAAGVQAIVNQARSHGIELVQQDARYQGARKISYYYAITDRARLADDIGLLRRLASEQGIKAMLTRCNPAAGDPENCYDVDFIPAACGKDAVVHFVRDHFAIHPDNTYAFGDSCNDLAMLGAVRHPYLVGNAEHEARQHVQRHTRGHYCHGILEALTGHAA